MRMITTLIAIVAGGYVLLGLALYVLQEKMVFLPHIPGRTLDATPQAFGLDYVDVEFTTTDGLTLHGWYVNARQPRGAVLFFHGNAGNISHRLDSIAIFNELGLDTFIIDYRGYGQSDGKPSEAGLYRDAEAAWQHLVEGRGMDPGQIGIFGRSIGGAAAASLASKHRPGFVIIESSFTSAADMAAHLYPFMPARLLSRLRFPVIELLAESSSPVLIVHSRDDEIVPFFMGRALFDAAPSEKAFLELSGDHNSGFIIDRSHYITGLGKFLDAHLRRADAYGRADK